MAQNRVMKAKNAKVKKLTMQARKDSSRRVMQDSKDPRNISLTLFKEKPGVCRPVRLKREPGQKWGCTE